MTIDQNCWRTIPAFTTWKRVIKNRIKLTFYVDFVLIGYTQHKITDGNGPGIVVELGTISIINHIKILLWDKDNRSYSYFIEVSVNQEQWDRVVDYQEFDCRSFQHLYFTARAIRYIKLVGTHNTENEVYNNLRSLTCNRSHFDILLGISCCVAQCEIHGNGSSLI